ncbi:hypothetical protein HY990_01980 [Candidatus Micrarchaeota archaeon]|nr:hypothetical protein [Candidatus Micrarchaeota archaeon]
MRVTRYILSNKERYGDYLPTVIKQIIPRLDEIIDLVDIIATYIIGKKEQDKGFFDDVMLSFTKQLLQIPDSLSTLGQSSYSFIVRYVFLERKTFESFMPDFIKRVFQKGLPADGETLGKIYDYILEKEKELDKELPKYIEPLLIEHRLSSLPASSYQQIVSLVTRNTTRFASTISKFLEQVISENGLTKIEDEQVLKSTTAQVMKNREQIDGNLFKTFIAQMVTTKKLSQLPKKDKGFADIVEYVINDPTQFEKTKVSNSTESEMDVFINQIVPRLSELS